MTTMFSASAIALLAALALCAGLIVLLFPILRRYALARPNARSSHRIPTPQGGGIAIIAATLLVAGAAIAITPVFGPLSRELAVVAACAAILAIIGAVDDIRPLDALPRLVVQAMIVAALVAALPAALRIIPLLPWWIERALMVLALVWLVNLTNFMDGIDWITVAEVVPVTAALGIFGLLGALPPDATLIAFALCGATLGFAPFNRPLRACSWATSAACRSGSCSAGCWCISASITSPRRCCCRSIISPTPRSRCCGAGATAKNWRRRTDRISISARSTAACR